MMGLQVSTECRWCRLVVIVAGNGGDDPAKESTSSSLACLRLCCNQLAVMLRDGVLTFEGTGQCFRGRQTVNCSEFPNVGN